MRFIGTGSGSKGRMPVQILAQNFPFWWCKITHPLLLKIYRIMGHSLFIVLFLVLSSIDDDIDGEVSFYFLKAELKKKYL